MSINRRLMWRSKWLHNIFFDVDGKRSCCHEKELRGLSESTLSGKYRKIFELHDSIPEGCILYGISNDEPCWTIIIPPEETRTGPSRIICVSKKSGKIIYDGSTGDELSLI